MTGPRDNWDVFVRCRDCGRQRKLAPRQLDYSRIVTEMENGDRCRLVLIGIPQDCPRCHNLHVVEGAPSG